MERSHEHLVPQPAWYGRRYPTWEDLETFAWELGASVMLGPISKGSYFSAQLDQGVPAVIGIPETQGPLARMWALAHELGHLVQHAGAKGSMFWQKDEAQANRWAARALIPQARIRHHQNASPDAFIGALSAHYEDLPLRDCPQRSLAARIAIIRLKTVGEVA